jgi:O-antigen ligase
MTDLRRVRARKSRSLIRIKLSPDLLVAACFIVAAFLFGGGSRRELLSHIPLRLISLCAIGYAVWRATPYDRSQARPYVLSVLAIGGFITAQLIPLPPVLWASLPGRELYVEALQSVKLADQWRPISMAPDLTLNSLLALLPVLAAAMLFAPLDDKGRRALLNVLLGCLVISGLLSIIQVVSQSFYFYAITSEGSAVGTFANRNHQALFLAIGIALILGRWRLAGHNAAEPAQIVLVIGSAIVIFPLLVVAGSRAGLALGLLSFVLSIVLIMRVRRKERTRWKRFMIPAIAIGLASVALLIVMASTRQLAFQRIFETLSTTDLRTAYLPAMLRTAQEFFPVGVGFGTFDAIFRSFEPVALLSPDYMNHAHSEPIELVIEGGIVAAIILIAAMIWLIRRTIALFGTTGSSSHLIMAQTGVLGLILLSLSSLVDYPMRTSFLAVIGMLFITWVGDRKTS